MTGRHVAKGMVAVVVIALWFMLLSPNSLGGPVSLIWVSGTSMEPTMETGDLALLYRGDSYSAGDIVAFTVPEGGNVIHRVVRTGAAGYEFRGDNRDRDDPWTLGPDAILGREVFTIPGAARMLDTLRQPWVVGLLVASFVLLFTHRPDDDEGTELGPGYLTWGVVPGRPIWMWPTMQRHRRRVRAKHLIDTYRRELIAFQQEPVTPRHIGRNDRCWLDRVRSCPTTFLQQLQRFTKPNRRRSLTDFGLSGSTTSSARITSSPKVVHCAA